MSIDPDTLTNDDLAALDPSTMVADSDDQNDVMEALNSRDLADDPPPELPDLTPPPSLDPIPLGAAVSAQGNGWQITVDDDGAVHTIATEDITEVVL